MPKFIIILTFTALSVTAAEPQADYLEGTDSTAVITPEIRAAASVMVGHEAASNLLHGVFLTMRKYDMDMRNDAGRRAWHGRLISETVNTNGLYKLQTYSNTVDGVIWTYRMPFKPVKAVPTRTQITLDKTGVPARLAAARAAREKQINQGAVVTNVVISVH